MHFSENYAIILSVLSASLPDTKRTSAWGISTVGSARHSHCRGQEFESPMLHGRSRLKSLDLFFCFQTSRKKSRPDGGFLPCPVGFCLRILLSAETLPGRGQRFFTQNQHSRITNLLKADKIKFHIQNTLGFPTANQKHRTVAFLALSGACIYSSSPPMASFSVRQPSTAHFTRAGMCEMSFSAPASSSSSISSAVASP